MKRKDVLRYEMTRASLRWKDDAMEEDQVKAAAVSLNDIPHALELHRDHAKSEPLPNKKSTSFGNGVSQSYPSIFLFL